MLRQRSRAPYARQRTDRAAWWTDDCYSSHAQNAIMRVDRKLLVLGESLAGAMSALIAGCGNPQDKLPKSPASTTVGTEIGDTVVRPNGNSRRQR
jgi:hypothetical protein